MNPEDELTTNRLEFAHPVVAEIAEIREQNQN
jgi:hypothetical protein